jgi:hypothetical protein
VVRIHSPRPTFSNTYRHSHLKSGSTQGPFLDPTLTQMLHSLGCCRRVLIDLLSDDIEDPLSPYQEVWSSHYLKRSFSGIETQVATPAHKHPVPT